LAQKNIPKGMFCCIVGFEQEGVMGKREFPQSGGIGTAGFQNPPQADCSIPPLAQKNIPKGMFCCIVGFEQEGVMGKRVIFSDPDFSRKGLRSPPSETISRRARTGISRRGETHG